MRSSGASHTHFIRRCAAPHARFAAGAHARNRGRKRGTKGMERGVRKGTEGGRPAGSEEAAVWEGPGALSDGTREFK